MVVDEEVIDNEKDDEDSAASAVNVTVVNNAKISLKTSVENAAKSEPDHRVHNISDQVLVRGST